MNDIQSRIEVLRPKAGDTIVVHIDASFLTADQRERIREACRASLPTAVRVMVLDRGVSLTHIAAADQAQPERMPEPIHFDAVMRDSTESAHRDFMRRTSCLPAGRDLRPTIEQVAQFHCPAIGFID